MSNIVRYTHDEWKAEAKRRFGGNSDDWKFVCPCCKHVTRVKEWRDAGAEKSAAYSCIGRYTKVQRDAFEDEGPGPCNYAGGGLFKLNPVIVTDEEGREHSMFDFAECSA